MPKSPRLPLNGLFPIEKPSGPSSMQVLERISPLLIDSKLFYDPERMKFHNSKGKRKRNTTDKGLKIGQGGTLDPLADGVLVVGINRGTKHLQELLEGPKEYEAIGLLGAATTTMDSEGEVLSTGDFDSITRTDVEKALETFNGTITQTPPIFSALKMEGKPLYEYARSNTPLPRAIPTRQCQVSIKLLEFTPASKSPGDGGHDYRWPEKQLTEEDKRVFRRLTELVHASSTSEPPMPDIGAEFPETSGKTGLRPATFRVRMTVSGGTYVRSIVHDMGLLLGCGAHVVLLRRTRQGQFVLDEKDIAETSEEAMVNQEQPESFAKGRPTTACIPWSVWEDALAQRKVMLADEAREKEELLAAGTDPKQVREQFSEEALRLRRMDRPEMEWEKQVLRWFIDVPIPVIRSSNNAAHFR
ncbi:putative pseudouridylate synthase 4 [Kockovaella imperatae]|uniref:tRNA pseudouridine(55) synthase n=1 Tax=Kockovaella imperatae TaxID=4999 RepID=A0A1Y1U808_9TREE|nr:putative pseudouridylate synthase 4 [Kockovaella imperatae]ORX33637.1 putative pseudouridylate synthase 4 [Kockovaella imperatae]